MNQPLGDKLIDFYLDEWAEQFVEEHPCESGAFQDIYPDLGSGSGNVPESLAEGRDIRPAMAFRETQSLFPSLGSHLEDVTPWQFDHHLNDAMTLSSQTSTSSLTFQQVTESPATIHCSHNAAVAQENEAFRFESGAVVLEDKSRPSKETKKPQVIGDFKCKHPTCRYRGTFRRSYELQRHMKKHAEERFQCPVQNCEKNFYRIDKVRHHLMESHTINESTCCPLYGCKSIPYPLGLLGVHVLEHPGWFKEPVLQVFSWLTDGKRCCPKPSCKEWIHVSGMQVHIQSHHISERQENEEAIRKSGYDINANIICPVCGKVVTTLASFEAHMETRHLVVDMSHLQSCRFAAEESTDEDSRTPAWEPWKTYDTDTIICQNCYSTVDRSSGWIIHHLGLLQDSSIIKPFRLPILELLGPEFASHPVFDDVRVK